MNDNHCDTTKKPKATMCTEYRTLSLMSHLLKMILRIILMRNRQKIENEIPVNFKVDSWLGRAPEKEFSKLRMICERYSEVNQDVYARFIDYEKAFDRVNHEKMIKCLNDIEINGKDLKILNIHDSKPILDTESIDPAEEKPLR